MNLIKYNKLMNKLQKTPNNLQNHKYLISLTSMV